MGLRRYTSKEKTIAIFGEVWYTIDVRKRNPY